MESKYYEIRNNDTKRVVFRIKTFTNNDALVLNPEAYGCEIQQGMAEWFLTGNHGMTATEITREQFALSYSLIIQEQIRNI